MSEEIADARRIMREAFERDRAFKKTYIANVAMVLYDEPGIMDNRERVAEKILDRIFSK